MLYEHFTSNKSIDTGSIIERAKRAHSLVMTFEIFHIIERAKRAQSLFMSIEISDIYRYICSRSSRLVYPFSPYTPEAPVKIILKIYSILGISGNFNVCGSSRFPSEKVLYIGKARQGRTSE